MDAEKDKINCTSHINTADVVVMGTYSHTLLGI